MEHDGEDDAFPDIEDGAIPDETAIIEGIEDVTLTPAEHQQIKDLVHGQYLTQVKNHDRRYLVVGEGGSGESSDPRQLVYDSLDERTDPPAIAMQLEDLGLTPDEIRLWVRVFDILCGMATHIVAVIEDFDGGYVWELGLIFSEEYRQKTWVLKRRYPDEMTEREKYDNGMGASHVKLLLTGPRASEWVNSEELEERVRQIP